MPGYRPDERNIRNCSATKETIRNMVRYVSDDEKIAAYTKAPLDMVEMARRNMRVGETVAVDRIGFRMDVTHEDGNGEGAVWERRVKARRGSDKLAAALAAYGR